MVRLKQDVSIVICLLPNQLMCTYQISVLLCLLRCCWSISYVSSLLFRIHTATRLQTGLPQCNTVDCYIAMPQRMDGYSCDGEVHFTSV